MTSSFPHLAATLWTKRNQTIWPRLGTSGPCARCSTQINAWHLIWLIKYFSLLYYCLTVLLSICIIVFLYFCLSSQITVWHLMTLQVSLRLIWCKCEETIWRPCLLFVVFLVRLMRDTWWCNALGVSLLITFLFKKVLHVTLYFREHLCSCHPGAIGLLQILSYKQECSSSSI